MQQTSGLINNQRWRRCLAPLVIFPPTLPSLFFFFPFFFSPLSLSLYLYFFFFIFFTVQRMCAGLCRLVYARTKRNNEFSTTACPASDSFDIGFCVERKWMVMGTGTDPFVRVHSIFISFYTFRVCSLLFFIFWPSLISIPISFLLLLPFMHRTHLFSVLRLREMKHARHQLATTESPNQNSRNKCRQCPLRK